MLKDENKYVVKDRILAGEQIMIKKNYDPQSDYIHRVEKDEPYDVDFPSGNDKKRLDLLEKGKFDLIRYNKITKQWGVLDSEDGFLYASDSSLRKCIDKLFGIF